jgi:hypothetical protein
MIRSVRRQPCPSRSTISNYNGPQSCGRFLSWKIFALVRLPGLAVVAVTPVVIVTVPTIRVIARIHG